jgi:hypothetical protein
VGCGGGAVVGEDLGESRQGNDRREPGARQQRHHAAHPRPGDRGGSVALAAGTVYLTHFSPLVDATIPNLAFRSDGTAWTSATLVRFELWTIAANGQATLVAASANDPIALTVASKVYSLPLDSGGGCPPAIPSRPGSGTRSAWSPSVASPGRCAAPCSR